MSIESLYNNKINLAGIVFNNFPKNIPDIVLNNKDEIIKFMFKKFPNAKSWEIPIIQDFDNDCPLVRFDGL